VNISYFCCVKRIQPKRQQQDRKGIFCIFSATTKFILQCMYIYVSLKYKTTVFCFLQNEFLVESYIFLHLMLAVNICFCFVLKALRCKIFIIRHLKTHQNQVFCIFYLFK
jgi:hypothetical protein